MHHSWLKAVLIILALIIFIMGVQFIRGKWLRLIAGNMFADETELNEQRKLGLASAIGKGFIFWSLFVLVTAIVAVD